MDGSGPGPVGRVVTVAGASGGVGASALAAAVATRGVRAGRRVVLVDGCPLGGGLDVTLGAEQRPGLRWPELANLSGEADGPALLARLPVCDGVPVLSHDRAGPPGPVSQVCCAVVDALALVRDLVVVDLCMAGEAADLLGSADRCVVVGGTRLRQVAALSVAARHVRERRGWPGPLACCLRDDGDADEVVQIVEAELGLPVLARVGFDKGLVADLVHGVPPGSRSRGPLSEAADEVLAWALEPQPVSANVGATVTWGRGAA